METTTEVQSSYVFTMDTIRQFCEARDTGRRVEVDAELWYYFLEVLPPVHMGYRATVRNAAGDGDISIQASFGFAEGCEPVTAFWQGHGTMLEGGRFFCQRTKEMNRC